jgi:hypothetical protein
MELQALRLPREAGGDGVTPKPPRPHAPTWASLFASIQVEQVDQRRLYNELAALLSKQRRDIEYFGIILRGRDRPPAPRKRKRRPTKKQRKRV